MTSPHLLIPTATPAATKSLATSVATKATTTSAQPGATSTTIVVHVPKVPTAARTTSPNARALPDHVTAQRVRDMARKSDAEKARTARLERARVREMWRGVFKPFVVGHWQKGRGRRGNSTGWTVGRERERGRMAGKRPREEDGREKERYIKKKKKDVEKKKRKPVTLS
ncbi:hypothetical protein C1H76_5928 [Elsinoe australis]|uniref:Uncharacterized protein n=1 Tax=Elsinoe australis TaxID=40998 RepID=A0A4U7B3G2_9PEZI|nr:hypothetical protein C1H76_5928 [Elsinoe australis]